MGVKKWLMQGRTLCIELEEMQAAKEKTLSEAVRTTSTIRSDTIQTAHNNNSEQKMINYTDYSYRLDELTKKLNNYRELLFELIWKIENPLYRIILIERYILGNTWETIAFKIGKTLRHTYRLHGEAITAAQKSFDNCKKIKKCH